MALPSTVLDDRLVRLKSYLRHPQVSKQTESYAGFVQLLDSLLEIE